MPDNYVPSLVTQAREEISAAASTNRFLDLLDAGLLPRERLTWLAAEEYRIVSSDKRSFALLASRFPRPPAGDLFLSLAQGEAEALRLLANFAAALDLSEKDLEAYEPKPRAQIYPAYLAQCALFGTSSAVALAMLANLEEWGGYCKRAADALRSSYQFSEEAVGFFRFFATPPPGFEERAIAVIQAGLAAGEPRVEAIRAARMLHAYETAFWSALAEGL